MSEMDMEGARRHVLQQQLEDNPRKRVLDAYRNVLCGNDGEVVLADLLEAYHHRESLAVTEEVAELPHPYRAYFIEGQRSVVVALRALAAQLNDQGEEV